VTHKCKNDNAPTFIVLQRPQTNGAAFYPPIDRNGASRAVKSQEIFCETPGILRNKVAGIRPAYITSLFKVNLSIFYRFGS
jgi:hypothetical protein